MELGLHLLEEQVGRQLDSIGFPRHELAAENVLAAIRLDILNLQAEEERKLLNASILAGRSGLLAETVELEIA